MTEENSMSDWFQDNLRIIISIGIVILLVFAIYSYSKRNSRTDVVIDDSQIEEVAMTIEDDGNAEINEIIDEIKDEEIEKVTNITSEDALTERKEAEDAIQKRIKAEEEKRLASEKEIAEKAAKEISAMEQEKQSAKDDVKEVIESRSRQKEDTIVVIAISGDSKTTLARKAVAEYITKNNVSGLTPAHKIYIEDYIQKATNASVIHSGTELGFSNTLISSTIEKSRALTSNQLSNLDNYAQNVSSL